MVETRSKEIWDEGRLKKIIFWCGVYKRTMFLGICFLAVRVNF